jgi:class 3 adenylate cyclase
LASEPTPPDSAPGALERRLATILAADVAGYSRMMGENEEATVQTLRSHRAVFDALLKQHHGRVFNTAGDAILAEFPSAVEAVRCATEIQAALQTRNAQLASERKMLFRMGVNLGDVVVQEGDLLGDGVNVAARIQTLAEPGGICISGSVYDQIQNKLSLQFRPLGNQSLKNIAQPVRTFSITQGDSGVLPAAKGRPAGNFVRPVVAALGVIALVAGGYWLYRDNGARRLEQSALTAQLAAEKQASADARRAAEEQSQRAAAVESKAEQERLAAEAAKREAALRAQAQSLEETRRRNDAERKRLDEERQQLEAAKQASVTAPKSVTSAAAASAERPTEPARPAVTIAPVARTRASAAASPTAQTGSSTAFDGTYEGRMCNFPENLDKRVCWKVEVMVHNGAATGTWTNRITGKSAHLQATIAPQGRVKLTLDGWNAKQGEPMSGAMDGYLADNHLDVAGRWANGVKIDGHWARSP